MKKLKDRRISSDGVIVIKAQRYRSQEKNREDALSRLQSLLASAGHIPKMRRPTKSTRSARLKRLEVKTRRSEIKSLRGKVTD